MNPMNLTGLQLMQAMIDGQLPAPSISHTIPMVATGAEAGKVRFEVQADDRHLNPLGGVHGGFTATVMDSVTGCAVHTLLSAGVGYGTVDLNVKMVRPVPRGVTLIAEGKVINLSRSLGISEGTLTDRDGKVYAHATASCMIQAMA
ncbi:uncharacterized domain 1-containing protein [Ferrimonas sediminum]|uniref:Uncharacterized domain 1-containing protein n=1 Tax=Ferrimonas sediminum TaxID=718193 RepID=A0A1G8R4A5_9GAMM|nr:PaaI family thioesterase [Ferrimonas sediminum]SDJ11814.1 uncharacterized domain 1-containing protein [Ferrimonas sediminum]